MQRFRGGLVFKAHRLCVSLNSRLESTKEEGTVGDADDGEDVVGGVGLGLVAPEAHHFTCDRHQEHPCGSEEGSYLRLIDLPIACRSPSFYMRSASGTRLRGATLLGSNTEEEKDTRACGRACGGEGQSPL